LQDIHEDTWPPLGVVRLELKRATGSGGLAYVVVVTGSSWNVCSPSKAHTPERSRTWCDTGAAFVAEKSSYGECRVEYECNQMCAFEITSYGKCHLAGARLGLTDSLQGNRDDDTNLGLMN
jgi:hypothetical protein